MNLLLDLPVDIYECVLAEAVLARGIKRALRMRLVSKQFSEDVQRAMFATRMFDSHRSHISNAMIPNVPLWRSYLLHRIYSSDATTSPALREILATAKSICDANRLSRAESLQSYVKELCLLMIRVRGFQIGWLSGRDEKQFTEADSRAHLLTAAAHFNCMPLVASLTTGRYRRYRREGSILFKSPIGAAAYLGHTAIVEYLLANTEKFSWETGNAYQRRAAIVYASWGGHLETLSLAIEPRWGGGSEDWVSVSLYFLGRSLQLGMRNNHPVLFRRAVELLEANLRVQGLGYYLADAAKDGSIDVVSYLLEIGTPPNGLPDGYVHINPLRRASRYGRFEVAEILLKYGAEPNVIFEKSISDDGLSSLAAAARGGYLSIVRLLLDNGAKVNEGSAVPAIYYALELEHTSMFHLLLERGALLSNLPYDISKSLHEKGMESMAKLVAQEISNLDPAGNDTTLFPNGSERECAQYVYDSSQAGFVSVAPI